MSKRNVCELLAKGCAVLTLACWVAAATLPGYWNVVAACGGFGLCALGFWLAKD